MSATAITMAPVSLRIHAIAYGADDVLLFDLRSPEATGLAPFDAGSHIDLRLPRGITRSYSLLNDPAERHRYVIGVKREPDSRGGSAWLHGDARVGALLDVDGPRNSFALNEAAPHSVFIAGGIGITPLWSMAQRLEHLGRGWTLHYRARSRRRAALVDELAAHAARVQLSFRDAGDAPLDLGRIVAQAPEGAHFYCCGPVPMLESFETACAGLDPARVHLEYFAAKDAPATEGGFVVHLARSGRTIPIQPGCTVLDALQAAGVAVPSSCQQGVCGVCETRVLSGEPDHRDLVLTAQERAANKTMMICCSGSKTPALTLDI